MITFTATEFDVFLDEDHVGLIKYDGADCKYWFEPNAEVVYGVDTLTSVIKKLNELNKCK